MSDDVDPEDDDGVPDSDPRQIDPAGDMADLVESGELDMALAEDQDPGVEATVRIARAILDDHDGGE
ncbi:hypothetical protein Halar_0003 (plasmid) [halophilic archaeon DL31]|jgi:hypothetical protein|nr:hypothetical protein Halar_0003 [halophilic archaeon DL31]